jgi:hypothetical protein
MCKILDHKNNYNVLKRNSAPSSQLVIKMSLVLHDRAQSTKYTGIINETLDLYFLKVQLENQFCDVTSYIFPKIQNCKFVN